MKTYKINGWTVLFKDNSSPITNIKFVVNTGSSMEKVEKEYGAAHFLEHMFFKGTKFKDYKEINKTTARLGSINASTSYNETMYFITALSKNFKDAFAILAEMFFHSSFPADEFEIEKGTILAEEQSCVDNPSHYFFYNMTSNIYGAPGHDIIGTKKSIAEMNIQTLLDFKSKYYNKENIILSVVGGVPSSEFFQILSEILPTEFPSGDLNTFEKPTLNLDPYTFQHNSEQSFLDISYPCPSPGSNLQLEILTDLLTVGLGGGMFSMLFDRLREELGLCYSASSFCDSVNDESLIHLYVQLNKKNVQQATAESRLIVESVKKHGFSDDVLDVAKRNFSYKIASAFEGSASLNSMMANDWFQNGGITPTLTDFISCIDNVKNDDIISIANQTFNASKLTVMNE